MQRVPDRIWLYYLDQWIRQIQASAAEISTVIGWDSVGLVGTSYGNNSPNNSGKVNGSLDQEGPILLLEIVRKQAGQWHQLYSQIQSAS